MEKRTTKKSKKKWLIIPAVVVVLAVVGVVFVLPRIQAAKNSTGTTNYRTQALTKGSISSTVGASGNVYTAQTVTLNWSTSGVVSQVHVSKGQQVSAGTVLAELDQASLPQNILSANLDLANAQQALDDLLNSGSTRAKAQLALIQADQALIDAQKAAQSKLYQRASQTVVDTAKANLIQAQAALDRASDIYNQNKSRSDTDVQYAAALSQFAAAQQKFDSAQMNYQYVQSLPSALEVQQANAQVDVAQAAYQDAKRAWEKVKDGPNALDVAAAEAKVAVAQATLDQAKITAPISGTITAIYSQPGDLVSGQTTAFRIDDLSHLYVDVSVSELDINTVKIGQPVAVTFDAIADKTYTGQVKDISDIGSSTSGAVNYSATVEITDQDNQVKPGMTASASVTVTQKNDVLLVPSSAIRTVNNHSVVYIMQNNVLRAVTITTGDVSTTESEVTSPNLAVGDLIVLNPPSSTTSTTATRGGGIFGGLFGGIFGGGRQQQVIIEAPGGGGFNGQPPTDGNFPGGSNSSGGTNRSGTTGGNTNGGSNAVPGN